MIFDAFIADGNILASNTHTRWRNQVIAVILKSSDQCIKLEDLMPTRHGLIVGEKEFEYLYTDNAIFDGKEISVILIDIPIKHWNAQRKALFSELTKKIDTQELRKNLSDLPFKSSEAALIFYLNEFFFCTQQGAIPLGLCLLEKTPSALENATYLGSIHLEGIT